MRLCDKEIVALIQPGGALSSSLPFFESREEQQKMLLNILEAYREKNVALIEAGTGTGKSIAYLIPAILWALYRNERTVIATNTISLQEQLLKKDIPLLTKALGISFKAVLVKGMSNYLCFRKLHDALEESALFKEDVYELEAIAAWSLKTQDGTRSGLPMAPKSSVWEKVNAESDTCNSNQCPHFQKCFFFKARKEAMDAHIIIANHHLLCADLAKRAEKDLYEEDCVLPKYDHVVVDEAHHLEDVATEFFSSHTSRVHISRILARLASEKQGIANGKVPFLRKKVMEIAGNAPSGDLGNLISRLSIDLPAMRRDLLAKHAEAFQAFSLFLMETSLSQKQEELPPGEKMRVRKDHYQHHSWKENIHPRTQSFIEASRQYIQELIGITKQIELQKNSKLEEATRNICLDIVAFANRLEESCMMLEGFMKFQENGERVRWIETQMVQKLENVHLFDVELDISNQLAEAFLKKFKAIVLCSATLTSKKLFTYIRQRLGIVPEKIAHRKVTENIYDSPFNYSQQSLLIVPKDLPEPSHPLFHATANEQIWQAIQASHGNAFILFTSYSMLESTYAQLAPKLAQGRYPCWKQGMEQRHVLLDKFKTTDRSVLFGTDSFWEGVDVVGEALRCVIIVKLPFLVPSEPIVQARSEAIQAAGKDPFKEYSIPNAVVKFKQGFGRLIRNKNDRGCIVCLDSRLINKAYGKYFLDSLPDCQRVYVDGHQMYDCMAEFYRRTYYVTKK